MARGGKGGGGGGASNAKELKMFMQHRMWRDHWLALSAVGSIIVALFAGFFIQFSYSETRMHLIHLDDAALVRRVFKSGEPWVVLCANADSVIPEVFDKASERLLGKVQIGVLDCNDRLPSGKSVYDKFSIRRDITPTVFTVANGEKPKQLFLNYLQKSKALAAQALVQTAKELHEVQTTGQLQDKCLSKANPCMLVFRGPKKFEPFQKKWLRELMHSHRHVKFVWADASILKLSVESLLPKASAFDARVLLFQKRKGDNGALALHVKAHTSYFEQLAVDQFVSENLPVTAEGFKALTKPVTLKRRPKKVPKAPEPAPAKAAADVERQARERMEEESKVHFAESVDDDSEDTVVDDIHEDDEVLDLDEL
ncbi:hypothetical protein ACHHYP_12180 [Achlya hypogyna]|uniref:Thioredoxin domain-containing protein n=1 Tax=Achlya hypogyna TaxID=1202772 RepID=A0A1V9YHD8_ACHHY|nr:hypothetical protein ACHHYP_12180 [Achlya hypogyna]